VKISFSDFVIIPIVGKTIPAYLNNHLEDTPPGKMLLPIMFMSTNADLSEMLSANLYFQKSPTLFGKYSEAETLRGAFF
jgi:hypothetical protein